MYELLRIQDAIWVVHVEIARNLLRMRIATYEQIVQVTNLPLKKVKELAEEVAAEKKQ